jgi:hypothetical protein
MARQGNSTRPFGFLILRAMNLDRFSASSDRRRHSGRTERRGTRTGFHSWGAFAFGGLFVAVGTFVGLIGMRIIPVDPGTVHVPWWILTAIGVVFAAAGLALWGMAARQYRSESRRIAAASKRPDEPAFADYGWDPRGFAAPRWSRAAKGLALAIFMSLFLSVFNYWAFGMNGPWMVKVMTILFDLMLLAVWWGTLTLFGRTLKFSGSRIEFARFPYRLGEPVLVRWHPATGIDRPRKGTFTLRCVEEWFETRGHGKSRSRHLVQEETWSGTWHLEQPRLFARGEIIELRYELPPDALSTQLSAEKPVFWEFEVKLDLPGLDFQETYLVPIYG